MAKTKQLTAVISHGMLMDDEAIIITIGDGLCTAYITSTANGETMKALYYKMQELQNLGYKVVYK